MTIDHRKVVALATYESPFVKRINNIDDYQVTTTVTRFTKSVWLENQTDISYNIAIASDGVSFTLRSTGTVNYTVDWGDGNSETSTSNTLAHTYASSGAYTVKITSNSDTYRPYYNNSGDEDQITSIVVGTDDSSIFSNSLLTAFNGAQNMTNYSQWRSASSAVTVFRDTWKNCSGLTSFPLIDTSSGIDFLSTWQFCSGLTGSFPLIDTSNGTDFGSTWNGCSGITTFPALNTSSGTLFIYTWFNCSGLTSFPSINSSSGTNFNGAWRNCTGLTSFPIIDTSSGTNFSSTWHGCSGLTSFPSINLSSATTFDSAWRNCTSLTTFPSNQFDTTANLTAMAFHNAFTNCALTTQSIENILTSLDTNGQSNITLSLSSGTNAGKTTWTSAANTAYNNLVAKGWTITYNN